MIKLLFVLLSWSPSDSLRLETINGKQFIIHQIESKETLYSISRRYGVQVTIILENNPTSEGGISVGKILKVPYLPKQKGNGSKHVVAAKETLFSIARQYDVSVDDIKKLNSLTDNSLSLGQELLIPKKAPPSLASLPMDMKSISSTHTVVAKETMYSIARQYGITVQQLKEWNNLQDELPIGKLLVVTQPKYNTQSTTTVKPPTNVAELKVPETLVGTDEVKELGIAELMEGTDGNRKYLALHRTVKVGTILKIRNETTNQEVFVRISGQLPSTISSDVIIRISKSAYNRLGAVDPKFRAEVTYYK